MLDAEPPSVGGMRNMAQIIERSAVWALQIVQDLLDHASLDAGKLVLNREAIAPRDIVRAAQILFAMAAEDKSIEFLVDVTDELPLIMVDRNRVLQVITNLLSNAMAFTPAGGRVTLTVSLSDGPASAVLFRIADTGSGIDPEEIAHIFDWYWQSGRKRRGGAGLGLAIASRVVQAHGSRLFVASTVGVGTTFSFGFPGVSGT